MAQLRPQWFTEVNGTEVPYDKATVNQIEEAYRCRQYAIFLNVGYFSSEGKKNVTKIIFGDLFDQKGTGSRQVHTRSGSSMPVGRKGPPVEFKREAGPVGEMGQQIQVTGGAPGMDGNPYGIDSFDINEVQGDDRENDLWDDSGEGTLGGPGAQIPPSSPDPAPFSEDRWACSKCTYKNEPSSTNCDLCAAPRFGQEEPEPVPVQEEPPPADPLDNDDDEEDAPFPDYQDSSVLGEPIPKPEAGPGRKWTCALCTMDCPATAARCGTCGSPYKPPPPQKKRRQPKPKPVIDDPLRNEVEEEIPVQKTQRRNKLREKAMRRKREREEREQRLRDRAEIERRMRERDREEQAEPWYCGNCDTENRSNLSYCSVCSTEKGYESRQYSPEPEPAPRRPNRSGTNSKMYQRKLARQRERERRARSPRPNDRATQGGLGGGGSGRGSGYDPPSFNPDYHGGDRRDPPPQSRAPYYPPARESWADRQKREFDEKHRELIRRFPTVREDNLASVLKEKGGDLERASDEVKRLLAIKRQREAESNSEKEAHNMLMALDNIVAKAIVQKFGFIYCTDHVKAQIAVRLARTQPDGKTAFRDAVLLGVIHLLKLKAVIAESATFDHKMVHVVLTDGRDTSSVKSTREMHEGVAMIGKELGDLIKTFVVGISLDRDTKRDLDAMKRAGGDSVQVFHGHSGDVSEIFNRIEMSLFVREQHVLAVAGDHALLAKRRQLGLNIKRKDFVVLFTLDISGSMSGTRWRNTCAAVMNFCRSLGERDMIAIVLFNDDASIITGAD